MRMKEQYFSYLLFLVIFLLGHLDVHAIIDIQNLKNDSGINTCTGSFDLVIQAETPYELAAPFSIQIMFIHENGEEETIYSKQDYLGVVPLPTFTNLCRGTYSVQVTNRFSCPTTMAVDILDCQISIKGIMVEHPSNCAANNGKILTDGINITGGVEPYATKYWKDEQGNILADNELDKLPIGVYCYVVEDASNCLKEKCITLEDGALSTGYKEELQEACAGLDNGSISISVATDCQSPDCTNDTYSFFWFNREDQQITEGVNSSNTTSSVTNLAAGKYSVRITNMQYGCTEFKAFEIQAIPNYQPFDFVANTTTSADFQPIIQPACFGQSNGSIDNIIIQGGSPPFTGNWESIGGSAGTFELTGPTFGEENLPMIQIPILDNLAEETYPLCITDACGQQICKTFYVPQNTEIEILGEENSRGEGNSEIRVNVTGGSKPYTYDWTFRAFDSEQETPFSNLKNIFNLASGIYTLNVTDEKGCTESRTFTIQGIPCLDNPASVEFTRTEPIPNCDGSDLALDHIRIGFFPDRLEEEEWQLLATLIGGPDFDEDEEYTETFDITVLGDSWISSPTDPNNDGNSLPVERDGHYQLEVIDPCGIVRGVGSFYTCETCDFTYTSTANTNYYSLFSDLIFLRFEGNCNEPTIKISLNQSDYFDLNKEYTITWPEKENGEIAITKIGKKSVSTPSGSTTVMDITSGSANWSATDIDLDNPVIINATSSDGCTLEIPISLDKNKELVIMAQGVRESYLPRPSNGSSLRDYFYASFACDYCNPSLTEIPPLYIEFSDADICTGGHTDLVFFEYFPNSKTNPCTGGGRLNAYESINGEAVERTITIPAAETPEEMENRENITTDWMGNLRPNIICHDGGACVFTTLEVFGVEMERDILAQYCFEDQVLPDSDGDGIPNITDICPNDPNDRCDDFGSDWPTRTNPRVENEGVGGCTEITDLEQCIYEVVDCDDPENTGMIEGTTIIQNFRGKDEEQDCYYCFTAEVCRLETQDGNFVQVIDNEKLVSHISISYFEGSCNANPNSCNMKIYCPFLPGNATFFEVCEDECDAINECINNITIADRELGAPRIAFDDSEAVYNKINNYPIDINYAQKIVEKHYEKLEEENQQDAEKQLQVIKENFQFYPNPARNELTIELNLKQPRPVEVSLLNVLGEPVLVKSFNRLEAFHKEQLSLDNLSEGIFILLIKDDDQLLFSKKLIIAKNN